MSSTLCERGRDPTILNRVMGKAAVLEAEADAEAEENEL
jgi:hypothetical protein